MSRARVLWLMKGLGRGGAERLTTSCARELDRRRFDIEVAYVLPGKDALVRELERDGVVVHCLGRRGVRIGWVAALRRLLAEGCYDLVHTHSPVPAVATRLLVRDGAGPRLVHTEHNVWGRYRWPTYAANALTYARNDAVLAVSHGVRESAAPPRWAPRLQLPVVETLHHGIDLASVRFGPEARAAARALLELSDDALVLGSVANFTPKKDQVTLLGAVDELRRFYPDLQLVLIGSGPLQAALEQCVDKLGLQRNVRFLGSREDVRDLLPALDVFVLSSLHEGLSIALLEAMASGVAPVATAVGGVPEVIDHGAEGLLVPAQDPAALAGAVDKLLSDADLRADLSAAAQRKAQEFTIAPAARRMEALYDEVLAR